MLWCLWSADLPTLRDPAVLRVLKGALRAPRIDMDAQALYPAVRTIEGRPAAAAWANELIGRTSDPDARRLLLPLVEKP